MDTRPCRTPLIVRFVPVALFGLALLSSGVEAACPPAHEFGPYGIAGIPSLDLVVGDFDGDGVDDIATAYSNRVYVTFGSADGRPNQPVLLPIMFWIKGLAVLPDHDGDGRDELAIYSETDYLAPWSVEIYGAGADRQFAAVGSIPAVSSVLRDLAAEDFDGDGDVDIACLDGFTVRMYAQTGPWTFEPVAVPGFSLSYTRLAMGDFDGNGRNDLVGLESTQLSFRIAVFPASGMNATIAPTGIPTAVNHVAVADFDGDGRDDVVVSANHTYVYRVVETTATLRATLPSGSNVLVTGAGDVDHDGFVDIVHSYSGNPHTSWFRSTGAFEFAPVAPLTGSGRAEFIAWGDVDRDGVDDAIMGGQFATGIAGFLAGPPFLSALDCASTPAGPEQVVLADLDGDGDRDFAVLGTLSATIARYLGDGSGTTWSREDLPIEESARDLVVIDCDADGAADLLTLHTSSPARLLVRRGDGVGGYFPPAEHVVPDGPLQTLTADLDHDGDLDLVVLANSPSPTRVFHGDGAGGFVPVADIAVGYGLTDALLRDVDGDAQPDLVFSQGGVLRMARGVPTAEIFAPVVDLAPGGTQIEVLDANQDGRLDLASVSFSGYGHVSLREAGGGFSAPIPFPTGIGTRDLRGGDFDGDGFHDLIVLAQPVTSETATGTLHFLRGVGDGSFAPAGARGIGRNATTFALGDVTGDQRPDIVVTQRDDQSVLVAANILGGAVDVTPLPRRSSLVARVSPSPAFGPFGVELTGRPDQSVRVEMFDVAGRKIGTPRETRLGADGRGRLAMDAGGRAGVYFVRAVQGADIHVTRAVVLP